LGLRAQVNDSSACQYLNEINITGHTKTKDAVLFRELNIQKGDCINLKNLDELTSINQQRLMSLLLFNEVRISWTSISVDSINMDIFVLDKFPIYPKPNLEFADRNINVWLNEENHALNRINIGLDLIHMNFRGRREVVEVGGQLGYTQKLRLLYSIPFINQKQVYGAGFSISGLRNKEVAYKTKDNKLLFFRDYEQFVLQQYEFAAWLTYRPKYAVTHRAQLNFIQYHIADTVAQLNPNYLGNGNVSKNLLQFQYRLDYNGVDNWEYPLKGERLVGLFTQNMPLFDRQWQSVFYLQYDRYFNPFKHYYISTIFRGKTSFPKQQADIFRRNLGYDFDYVRGFEYYVIDGSDFALLRLNLKRTILDRKIRLPIRYFEVIPIRVYGKIYGDAGISHDRFNITDRLNDKGLFSAGIGLDIITLYDLKFRIEYTFNNLNEKDLFLHKSGE